MSTVQLGKSIFLFHRDLRLEDNIGLIEALKKSASVIPVFILDEVQISEKNSYRSLPALSFMKSSLIELNESLLSKKSQLYLFYGKTLKVLEGLIKTQKIKAIVSNRDYTPFARRRDEAIKKLCEERGIDFLVYDDALLHSPESVHKEDGTPYAIFTPFFRKAAQIPVVHSQNNKHHNYFLGDISGAALSLLDKIESAPDSSPLLKGGRKEGLDLIAGIRELNDYSESRDAPFNDQGTSFLSAHHKFGTISVRETYHAALHFLGPDSQYIAELYWRDFFTHIGFHFPHVFGHSFHQKYDTIPWQNDEKLFKKWCDGHTGFPIVDAGMRQLNSTGYMHNRIRMIVASFLVKDLHIDWKWGEQYFARQLIDYDPAVNNGSWQWAASTGCDAQPYFRIFNPMLQQKRYDPDSVYVKKWVPELKVLGSAEILKLYEFKIQPPAGYTQAIVNHKEVTEWAKQVYKTK